MLPVTGPFQEVVGSASSTSKYYCIRQRYRQKRPIDRPLPFTVEGGKSLSQQGLHYVNLAPANNGWGYDNQNPLKIIAYDRFKDEVQDNASLGVAVVEFGKSYTMISDRCLQLLSFVRKIKKGDLRGAAQTLQLPRPPKGVKPVNSAAKNYLEFHFGWSPMISDIYNAIDVLQSPLKTTHAKGSARGEYSFRNTPAYGPTGNPVWILMDWTERVKYGADVKVTNPNLNLANQLGLVNPATLVWEVIPFSFVVDWFVNAESFLASSSDFLGLEMNNTYTSLSRVGTRTEGYPNDSPRLGFSTVRLWKHDRILGLDKPSFGLRKAKVPGLRKALAACSLLALGLKSL